MAMLPSSKLVAKLQQSYQNSNGEDIPKDLVDAVVNASVAVSSINYEEYVHDVSKFSVLAAILSDTVGIVVNRTTDYCTREREVLSTDTIENSLQREVALTITSIMLDYITLGGKTLQQHVSSLPLVLDDEFDTEKVLTAAQTIVSSLSVSCNFCYWLLEHPQERIRNQAVDVVVGICRILLKHYEACSKLNRVTGMVLVSFQATTDTFRTLHNKLLEIVTARIFVRSKEERSVLLGKVSEVAMDDTSGWFNLEAALKAYHALILGFCDRLIKSNDSSSESFGTVSFISLSAAKVSAHVPSSSFDGSILSVIVATAASHINRHVREATLIFIHKYMTIVSSHHQTEESHRLSNETSSFPIQFTIDEVVVFLKFIIVAVSKGQLNEWSQIRLAATQACRSVIIAVRSMLPDEPVDVSVSETETLPYLQAKRETAEDLANAYVSNLTFSTYLESTLLPGLCMNRFYAAEAVKNAAQSSWRIIVGPAGGKHILEKNIEAFVGYYVAMSQVSSNHMVIEAACHAMSEACKKLLYDSIDQVAHLIRAAILSCLHDERWPVRDAACLAAGSIMKFHPVVSSADNEMHCSEEAEILHLCTVHLQDSIWSVRQNAAFALTDTIQSVQASTSLMAWKLSSDYLKANLERAIKEERELVLLAEKQREYSSVVTSETSKISSKMKRNFLPSSLLNPAGNVSNPNEPTVKVTGRGGWSCCIDCVELRACHPWEVSHGALYLLRELINTFIASSKSETFSRLNEINVKPSEVWSLISSQLEVVWKLLLVQKTEFSDKLHAAVYEEVTLLFCTLLYY